MTEKKADVSSLPSPAVPVGQLDVVKAKLKDVMSLKNLRGIVLFFGLGEQKPFQVPAKAIMMNRTRKNLLYFATNYAAVAILVGFVSILMNPFFLFVLMCIAAGWYQNAQISATETEDNKFTVMGRPVDANQRNVGMTGITALLIIYFGGSVLFSIASMSALLSASHAFLRNSNIPDDDDLGFSDDVALPEP
ncbi:hypothetical protein H310_06322 [Aphanomyces invadans]|uniref:PRA1 family protein n=1 Tax=Aphanomyces invadans TaxID=157072 RepID=A0A024U614_9STRA|nr:hypothetical protein H310_06322 [Aphanomyces invadans]ETW01714.1 hypothetical protein H310_06322 [Aphanomyces invadans]|eukprot:XP_008869562.1 hypothetical protein H310_06322 [Aphanomyces invadans]